MPKIPTPNPISTVKSPQKNPPTLGSTVYNPRSPPKLITNKSKNRLWLTNISFYNTILLLIIYSYELR